MADSSCKHSHRHAAFNKGIIAGSCTALSGTGSQFGQILPLHSVLHLGQSRGRNAK